METQFIRKKRNRNFRLDYERVTIISIYTHIEVSFINKIHEDYQLLKKPLSPKWICPYQKGCPRSDLHKIDPIILKHENPIRFSLKFNPESRFSHASKLQFLSG